MELEGLATTADSLADGVGLLVNCAGLFPVRPMLQSDSAEYDRTFAVNVRAPFLLPRRLAPGMVRRRWGRIVNIGSSSAYQRFPNTVAYCASKHALLGLSRALHEELKEHNVGVICVSPGSIRTPMGAQVDWQDYSTFMDPVEVAEATLSLAAFDAELVVPEVRLHRMVMR